jgi:hypothetical protein
VYFVGPCYLFPLSIVGPHGLPAIYSLQYATPASPLLGTPPGSYKSHGLSVRNTPLHPNYPFLYTMDAFRALLGHMCSPTAVASDPEAQLQHGSNRPQHCAWSTIAFPTLNRGSVFSRHDDPPLPSMLPNDTPPAYTYPPPLPPISGSDPSATDGTLIGHSLYATVVVVMLTLALFATSVYFSFFNHLKV